MNCPVCSNNKFEQSNVIKQRLVDEWELNPEEAIYINKQQGYHCSKCFSNFRSMTLAHSIMQYFSIKGNFQQIIYSKIGRKKKLLEINEAGNLHEIFKKFKNYVFAEYPMIDIQKLPYKDNSFDIIVHSDTLEHIKNTARALNECYRVLKPNGALFYTIPIINGRMTRRRDNLCKSFHGNQDESQGEDYLVWTEYGADFWVELNKAGFNEIRLFTLGDETSLAICARKVELRNYITKKKCFLKILRNTKITIKGIVKLALNNQ